MNGIVQERRLMMSDTPAPSGRPKDPKRHASILSAARAAFLRNGFDATSIEAIARTAGVSKVTVYGHFGSREALLEAVIAAEAEAINRALGASPVQDGDLAQQLTAFGLHLMTILKERDAFDLEHLVRARASQQPQLAQTYFECGPARSIARLAEILEPALGHRAPEASEMLFALWSGGGMTRVSLGLRPALPEDEVRRHIATGVAVIMRAYVGRGEIR